MHKPRYETRRLTCWVGRYFSPPPDAQSQILRTETHVLGWEKFLFPPPLCSTWGLGIWEPGTTTTYADTIGALEWCGVHVVDFQSSLLHCLFLGIHCSLQLWMFRHSKCVRAGFRTTEPRCPCTGLCVMEFPWAELSPVHWDSFTAEFPLASCFIYRGGKSPLSHCSGRELASHIAADKTGQSRCFGFLGYLNSPHSSTV